MNEGFGDLIAQIRDYTKQHRELQRAHHFAFDLPLHPKIGGVEYVVMGVNPGENADDWKIVVGPTEETRTVNYHENHARSRNSKSWYTKVGKRIPSEKISMTEMFFWSTSTVFDLHKEFGGLVPHNPHLQFCAKINQELIRRYKPKAVVFSGLAAMPVATELYALANPKKPVMCGNGRLLVEWSDGQGVPWVFTKHFSGGRRIRGEDDAGRIRDYLERLAP